MQRHRDERIDASARSGKMRREQQRESAAQRALAAVLQRVQVVVERRRIRERRDDGVDVPR